MMRFVAQLNDGSFVNTFGDRMEVKENMLFVYADKQLVALIEVTAIIAAHLRSLWPGALVIEDTKSQGTRTKEYQIKRKLMADKGYIIREV